MWYCPGVEPDLQKISSIDELTDGKYVIAYGEEYAMTNENAGKYFKHIAISPVDGAINTPDESIVWDIETTANGISIKNGGIYVGYNGSKNSATAYTEFTEKNVNSLLLSMMLHKYSNYKM